MAKQTHREASQASEPGARGRRATVVRPGGRMVLADGPGNARLFAYLAGNYVQRIEHVRREVYFGDLDLARVAEVVATAGVEPGMRDAGFRDRYKTFDNVVGVEGQRAVNATSIAAALGMPRETVRRKLRQLLKHGFIIEKERAHYVLNPGRIQEPHRQAAFAFGIEQTVRFMNDLLEHGVVHWVADGKARPA